MKHGTAERFLLLGVIFFNAPLEAATLYIAVTGSDSNACTQASPCLTVARAERIAGSGDTVQVSAGTYATSITLTKSGITYRGHSGSCPSTANTDRHAPSARPNPNVITRGWTVSANDITIDCFRIEPEGNSAGVGIDARRSRVTVKNNYIHGRNTAGNCVSGVAAYATVAPADMPTQIAVLNNYVTYCQYGMWLMATSSTAESNEFERMCCPAGNDDNDYLRLFGSGLTIRGNYMHGTRVSDCPGDCHIDCFQSYSVSGSNWETLKSSTIERNTCFNAHQGIIMRDLSRAETPSGSHDTITVRNNIFARGPAPSYMPWCMLFDSILNVTSYHNTCGEGLTGYRYGTTVVHRNNLHYNGSWSPLITDAVGSLTNTNNLYFESGRTYSYAGNINNQDPLLIDPVGGDFRLGAGSPAIGAGANVGVSEDRQGYPRKTAAPDIGAYEYFTDVPPAPPTNLRRP